jgi:hypothetical protein
MTTVEELTKRVSTLEDTVTHLSTHHDEQFVEIHDDMNAIDRCERLFNLDINRRAQSVKRKSSFTKHRRQSVKRRPRLVKVSKKQ